MQPLPHPCQESSPDSTLTCPQAHTQTPCLPALHVLSHREAWLQCVCSWAGLVWFPETYDETKHMLLIWQFLRLEHGRDRLHCVTKGQVAAPTWGWAQTEPTLNFSTRNGDSLSQASQGSVLSVAKPATHIPPSDHPHPLEEGLTTPWPASAEVGSHPGSARLAQTLRGSAPKEKPRCQGESRTGGRRVTNKGSGPSGRGGRQPHTYRGLERFSALLGLYPESSWIVL